MIIPPPLRAVASPHRAVVEAAFGPLRPVPDIALPAEAFLFLCFTNRCGSNYLAHLLATTGAFNEAGEYFNAPTVMEHAVPRGLHSLSEYFAVLPNLVSHSGQIVAKVGVDQLVMLADAGILDALGPRAHFLLLERQDRVAQAISRVIVAQNGRWTTAHESGVPDDALVYDRAAIDVELGKIVHANALFYLFFSANGIVPLHASYEAVLADPGPLMKAVAGAMGLEKLVTRPELVGIRRQANAVNREWRRRYEAVLF